MGNVPTPGPCDRAVRRARAEAYVDGLSDVLDLARPGRVHAWTLDRDEPTQSFFWVCACGHVVIQDFGSPAPDELISHPQSFGQLRGEP